MFARFCAALFVSLASFVLATSALASVAVPAGTRLVPLETTRADAYVRLLARSNNFSGVVFISRGPLVLMPRAYGLADAGRDIRNGQKTRFHIVALSRMFTAAAILLLEEDGKLSIADPVSKFMPTQSNGGSIRIENLLVHGSAGSNVDSDYDLLARIVEKVSGQSFGDFLKQRIFTPLRLDGTSLDSGAADDTEHLAVGTEPDGLYAVKNLPFLGWSARIGSGAIVSTGPDVCAFASALWGGMLLKPASVAKISGAQGADAYGWTTRERAGHKARGMDGRGPGFVASLDYFPDNGTCVAILTNSNAPVAQVIAPDMATIALGSGVALPPAGFEKPPAGALAPYSGTYRLPANFDVPNATVTLEDRGGYLEAKWSNGATSIIYPTGHDNFVERASWAMVQFTRDASGTVTGFEYHASQNVTATKVP